MEDSTKILNPNIPEVKERAMMDAAADFFTGEYRTRIVLTADMNNQGNFLFDGTPDDIQALLRTAIEVAKQKASNETLKIS